MASIPTPFHDRDLGMSASAATHHLKKAIILDFLRQIGKDACLKCGQKLESFYDLSIDHKKPWRYGQPELFWDISNIGFSHRACNKPDKPHVKIGPPNTAWCRRHHEFLPIEEFGRHARRKNGIDNACKPCRNYSIALSVAKARGGDYSHLVDPVITPGSVRNLYSEKRQGEARSLLGLSELLYPYEQQLLSRIASGEQPKDIAQAMGVPRQTVYTLWSRLKRRIKVSNGATERPKRRPRAMVRLLCRHCGMEFEREMNKCRAKLDTGNTMFFCSKSHQMMFQQNKWRSASLD